MSISDLIHSYTDTMFVDESTDHPKVRFVEEGMEFEGVTLMYRDHERNVFVYTHDSEIPYDVIMYDQTEYTATSLHVVFLQYIGDGTFEIVSSSRSYSVKILLEAFRKWGFKNVEYRPTHYSNYVQCNEKEAMLLKLKTGK